MIENDIEREWGCVFVVVVVGGGSGSGACGSCAQRLCWGGRWSVVLVVPSLSPPPFFADASAPLPSPSSPWRRGFLALLTFCGLNVSLPLLTISLPSPTAAVSLLLWPSHLPLPLHHQRILVPLPLHLQHLVPRILLTLCILVTSPNTFCARCLQYRPFFPLSVWPEVSPPSPILVGVFVCARFGSCMKMACVLMRYSDLKQWTLVNCFEEPQPLPTNRA